MCVLMGSRWLSMAMTGQFEPLWRGFVWMWASQPALCPTIVERSNVALIWYSNEHNLKSGCGEWAMSVWCYCLRPLINIFTFSSVHVRNHQKSAPKNWYKVGWQVVGGDDRS